MKGIRKQLLGTRAKSCPNNLAFIRLAILVGVAQ
jgi:hypothetical protein